MYFTTVDSLREDRAALTMGSLFTGIGGLDYAFETTGRFCTAWRVEVNPFCRAVLAGRGDGIPCYGDITGVDGRDVAPVDVLIGGFPCTGISTAGKQKGIEEDEHSGLWREFSRLIGEIQPRYVVVENVSALRSPIKRTGSVEPAGLGRVLGNLAAFGYNALWHCLPASAVGAPHRRDRIFIVAYTDSPQWRSQPEGWNGHLNGDDLRWKEAASRFTTLCTSGRGSSVADTDIYDRRWQERAIVRGVGSASGENASGERYLQRITAQCGSADVVDANEQRLERAKFLGERDDFVAQPANAGGTESRADGVGQRLAQRQALGRDARAQCPTAKRVCDTYRRQSVAQSRLGGTLDGTASWLDTICWPARPGEAQHFYEPPRTVEIKGPYHNERLKALGNAVVPQQAVLIALTVLALEERRLQEEGEA